MKQADVLIVGTGSLATGTVNALSQLSMGKIRVGIIGRSKAKASQLMQIANARAAIFQSPTRFEAPEISQFKALAFSRIVRSLKPKVILQAASLQSPWEAGQGENAWTKLVATAGFGITLPLQMALAAELSNGAGDTEAAIVNASYPDCVNVILDRLGLRATCGVGNAAIVEGFCRYRAEMSSDVRVIAHHGHLGAWFKGKRTRNLPRIWVNGREVESSSWHPHLGPVHDELNHVTAAAAASVVLCLLDGGSLQCSIPGVGGLPGGYPYLLKGGRFRLQLPRRITLEEAIQHNRRGEDLDGIDLETGVKFGARANKALKAVGFEFAQGFDPAEWATVCAKMILLRNQLRQMKVEEPIRSISGRNSAKPTNIASR
jgi:hypothetical protein